MKLDLPGTKSLSSVTETFLTSTRGEHVSIVPSAALPHSLSLQLWNSYLAFRAEKSKVAGCDVAPLLLRLLEPQHVAGFHCTTWCAVWAFAFFSFYFSRLCSPKTSYFLLQLTHLLSDSENAGDRWTLKGQSVTSDFPWFSLATLPPSVVFTCLHW